MQAKADATINGWDRHPCAPPDTGGRNAISSPRTPRHWVARTRLRAPRRCGHTAAAPRACGRARSRPLPPSRAARRRAPFRSPAISRSRANSRTVTRMRAFPPRRASRPRDSPSHLDPRLAAVEVLVLPDGHDLLHPLDGVAARRERRSAVRAGHDDRDARLANPQPSNGDAGRASYRASGRESRRRCVRMRIASGSAPRIRGSGRGPGSRPARRR